MRQGCGKVQSLCIDMCWPFRHECTVLWSHRAQEAAVLLQARVMFLDLKHKYSST